MSCHDASVVRWRPECRLKGKVYDRLSFIVLCRWLDAPIDDRQLCLAISLWCVLFEDFSGELCEYYMLMMSNFALIHAES